MSFSSYLVKNICKIQNDWPKYFLIRNHQHKLLVNKILDFTNDAKVQLKIAVVEAFHQNQNLNDFCQLYIFVTYEFIHSSGKPFMHID